MWATAAGRGADLFESTAAEEYRRHDLLGSGCIRSFGLERNSLPLVGCACFGLIASIIGVMIVKSEESSEDPMSALNRGYYVDQRLAIVGFFFARPVDACRRSRSSIRKQPRPGFIFSLCGVIGIAMAQAFVYITQYYTEYKYRPVKSIVEASQTGPATNIIAQAWL